eukprot:scaffold3.g6213.t1
MGCAASKGAGAKVGAEAVLSATVVPPAPAPAPKAAACARVPVTASAAPISLTNPMDFEGESDRETIMRSLGLIDTEPEGRFDRITALMANLFGTPVSLITLITEASERPRLGATGEASRRDRVWFKSKVGPFGACVSRDGSWCNYIEIPPSAEVLITEDASVDARFSNNPYVAGAPYIRFYAGAPLVGRAGVRYGTLCVVDLVARTYPAEFYALLANMAELVVQELERDSHILCDLIENRMEFTQQSERVRRAVSVATGAECCGRAPAHNAGPLADGVALVDTRTPAWPLLYANDAFGKSAGTGAEQAAQAGFWDQFELVPGKDGGLGMADVHSAVARGDAIELDVRCRASGVPLRVVLRPASTDQLTPGKPVGVPNWCISEVVHGDAGSPAGQLGVDLPPVDVDAVSELASCFWLVQVVPALTAAAPRAGSLDLVQTPSPVQRRARRSDEAPCAFGSRPPPPALDGLRLGPLIGSGAFGKTYRARWRNKKLVAIVDLARPARMSQQEDPVAEAHLSRDLKHPNITYDYALDEESELLWIVMQHCTRGTLMDAVERGWLREARELTAPPDVRAILRALRDVAAGMAYLHAQGVLHCDLTGNNVLLDAGEGGGPLVVRVCDFGLACRAAEGDAAILTKTVRGFPLAGLARGAADGCVRRGLCIARFGTVSHMPPELLNDGLLTPAADVWAFGVLAWELFAGERAHVGRRPASVVFAIISGRGALEPPAAAPPAYQELLRDCMHMDHQRRPTFAAVLERVEGMLRAEEAAPAV